MKTLSAIDNIRRLSEFEEARGKFRGFELRNDGILVSLEYVWSLLIPNSPRIVKLLRSLKNGDRVAIFCAEDSNYLQVREIEG